MAKTQAESPAMEATARQFETVNANLDDMLSRLLTRLEVLESQWRGRGGTAFTDVKLRWAADQKALHQALAETATAIRRAGRHYESTDSEASGRIISAGGGAGQTLPL